MFQALDFIFGNKFLSSYEGWFIHSISPTQKSKGSGELKVYQDFVYKKYKPLFQGATYQGNNTFDIRIGKLNIVDEFEIDMMRSWLEGYVNYRPLILIQDDLSHIHFNAMVKNLIVDYKGNQPAYITMTMYCDSPFGEEGIKTYNLKLGTNKHFNSSSNNDYTFPIVEFKSSQANGWVEIINRNDVISIKAFKIEDAIVEEIITVDCDKQIVSSNMRQGVLKNFNKKWLNLIQGTNELEVKGTFTDLKIKYANVRKVL